MTNSIKKVRPGWEQCSDGEWLGGERMCSLLGRLLGFSFSFSYFKCQMLQCVVMRCDAVKMLKLTTKRHSYRYRYKYRCRKAELLLELKLWCGSTNVRMRRAASLIISSPGRQRPRRDAKEGDDDDVDDDVHVEAVEKVNFS